MCPYRDCHSLFIAYFCRDQATSHGPRRLRRLAPVRPAPVDFSPEISSLSSAFCEIYQQAAQAEQCGLSEVAGVGYRKALKFLIKDNLIHKNPEKAETIKKKFLGKCIQEYIEDSRTRTWAELATWLGNDEDH